MFSGQVRMKNEFDWKEAVTEVMIHYQNYEKKDEDGERELVSEEDEHELEAIVRCLFWEFLIDSRFS